MSRYAYNITVQAYNNVVQTIPSSIVAWFAGFPARDYLAAVETERQTPVLDVPPPAAAG